MRSRTSLALALLLVPAGVAQAADLGERLQRGEIVTTSVPTPGVRPSRSVALIDAPPRVVRDILTGVDRYQSFVPRVTSSRRVKDHRFVVETDLPWPVKSAWAYVQVQVGARDGAEVMTWKMLNGTFKEYNGVAWIQPWQGKTLLTYQMLAVPKTIAPDGMMSAGLRDATDSVIQAVRKQARKILAENPGLRVAGQPSASSS